MIQTLHNEARCSAQSPVVFGFMDISSSSGRVLFVLPDRMCVCVEFLECQCELPFTHTRTNAHTPQEESLHTSSFLVWVCTELRREQKFLNKKHKIFSFLKGQNFPIAIPQNLPSVGILEQDALPPLPTS